MIEANILACLALYFLCPLFTLWPHICPNLLSGFRQLLLLLAQYLTSWHRPAYHLFLEHACYLLLLLQDHLSCYLSCVKHPVDRFSASVVSTVTYSWESNDGNLSICAFTWTLIFRFPFAATKLSADLHQFDRWSSSFVSTLNNSWPFTWTLNFCFAFAARVPWPSLCPSNRAFNHGDVRWFPHLVQSW